MKSMMTQLEAQQELSAIDREAAPLMAAIQAAQSDEERSRLIAELQLLGHLRDNIQHLA